MRHFGLGVLVLILATELFGDRTPLDIVEPIRVGPGVTPPRLKDVELVRLGPGVTPPRLKHKVEPKYTPDARAAYVQGTIVFELVIDESGRPTDISVIRPLGFGLDEQAQSAVEKWEFAPGKKAGVPVKVQALVNVNFRPYSDEETKRRRTAFNVALETLNQPGAASAAVDRAVKSMTDLCRRKFPPAMYVVGSWKLKGEHGPKDPAEGLDLVQKAAETKTYAPALFEVALRRIEGRDLAQDVDKGLQEMRDAATLGSRHAQFYLGARYKAGDRVPRELDHARRYFRLCAAQGVAQCQFRLARLLYDAPDRRERDYLQAIALFQLAAEQNIADAEPPLSKVLPKLTLEQRLLVIGYKLELVRR